MEKSKKWTKKKGCPEGKALGQKVSSPNKKQNLISCWLLLGISNTRHVVVVCVGVFLMDLCVCCHVSEANEPHALTDIYNRYRYHYRSDDYRHHKSVSTGRDTVCCQCSPLPAAQHINHWSLNQLYRSHHSFIPSPSHPSSGQQQWKFISHFMRISIDDRQQRLLFRPCFAFSSSLALALCFPLGRLLGRLTACGAIKLIFTFVAEPSQTELNWAELSWLVLCSPTTFARHVCPTRLPQKVTEEKTDPH